MHGMTRKSTNVIGLLLALAFLALVVWGDRTVRRAGGDADVPAGMRR